MFRKFLDFFDRNVEYEKKEDEYATFIKAFGNIQFGSGLFTVFGAEDVRKWEEIVLEAFPQFMGKINLFAHDWNGRAFGVAVNNGEKVVLIFDPGVMEVYEVPCSLTDFANKVIPISTNDCLQSDMFKKWYKKNGTVLTNNQCVCYKVPLFLGGINKIDNMEVSDMEVHWYITTQIWEQVKDLPEGTSIGEIIIE